MEQQQPQNNFPTKPSIKKAWPWTLAVIALFGFLDALFLTIKHFQGVPPPCSLLHGCEIVTMSSYSVIAGIPLALLGALYYFSVLILTIIFIDRKNIKVLRLAALLTIIGFIVSLVLVYLQFFVIHAICVYCMFSATTSTLLFIVGVYLLRLIKKAS